MLIFPTPPKKKFDNLLTWVKYFHRRTLMLLFQVLHSIIFKLLPSSEGFFSLQGDPEENTHRKTVKKILPDGE